MNQPSDIPATCCPTCGGSGETYDLEALEADAQALADVRTLDDYCEERPDLYWRVVRDSDGLYLLRVEACEYNSRMCEPQLVVLQYAGATPEAARALAAAWVREQAKGAK